MRTSLCSCASAASSSASALDWAWGFSTKTCFPAESACLASS